MSKPDYIYIIRQGDTRLFKIGVSNNPERRLKNLQTGNPHDLKILKQFRCDVPAYGAERIIHAHLKDMHARGEWFDIPTDDKVVSVAQAMLNALSGPGRVD